MHKFYIFSMGLISLLVMSEAKPYVSGVLPRLEKERLRKTTQLVPNESDNSEKWWPQDDANQREWITQEPNIWRPNNNEQIQSFTPTRESISLQQNRFPTTSYPDKFQSRIIFRDERDLSKIKSLKQIYDSLILKNKNKLVKT